MKPRLFHYTIGTFLPAIITDGVILARRLGRSDPSVDPSGREYVWLSKCTGWEKSAVKSVINGDQRSELTPEQLQADWGGLFRIEVSDQVKVLGWEEFVEHVSLPASSAKMLAERGREKGANPDEWFVTLRPIPREDWVALETWDEESAAWIPVEM